MEIESQKLLALKKLEDLEQKQKHVAVEKDIFLAGQDPDTLKLRAPIARIEEKIVEINNMLKVGRRNFLYQDHGC